MLNIAAMPMPFADTRADQSPAEAFDVTAMVSAAEWDEFVAGQPGATGYHAYQWRRVFERAFDHRCEYLAAFDPHGRVVGVLPLVVFGNRLAGRFLVSLPFVNHGGVLASSGAAAHALLEEAVRRGIDAGCGYIELRHIEQRFPDLPSRSHRVTMRARLAGTEDAVWSGLDRKVRNLVRKAEKAGLTVELGGIELLEDFYGVFARNMRDLGTPVYPMAFFAEMLRQFPDATRLFVVRQGRQPVAGSITYAWGSTLEVPSASSLREFRALCPNYLLYWAMMREAVRRGCAVFDFGRSTPADGTYHFKTQWGAEPGPLCWEYRLITSKQVPGRDRHNRAFQPAINLWKRLPLKLANLIGPRVVRYLP